MNGEPISPKERRKARAMVRDISKQVKFQNHYYLSADEWWVFFFAGAYGQEIVPNPLHQDFPDAPLFIMRNKKRTADLNVTDGSQFITALYAFGNTRGVEWSDPKWKAEFEADQKEAQRWAA